MCPAAPPQSNNSLCSFIGTQLGTVRLPFFFIPICLYPFQHAFSSKAVFHHSVVNGFISFNCESYISSNVSKMILASFSEYQPNTSLNNFFFSFLETEVSPNAFLI